jgi:GWxTD domain-containing protein
MKTLRLACFLACCVLIQAWSSGQEMPRSASPGREPLSRWSRQWLDEVVPYIITRAEKEVFTNLPTEEERGKFIAAFWKKRDPDPRTEENEFKLDYYRRIALANTFLGVAGMDGWRTDRGKILILLGPPAEVQRDFSPAGAIATIISGPRETWNYWGLSDPGLPYNLEFTFIDRTGTGHYVLDNGLDLTGQKSSPLDLDSLHLYFDYQEYLARAVRNPFEDLDKLRGVVTTQVSYDRLPVRVEWQSLKGTEGRSRMSMLARVPRAALKGKMIGGNRYDSLTLMVKVSDMQGRPISEQNKDFNFKRAPAAAGDVENGVFELPYALNVEPGPYKVLILVLDNFTGRTGLLEQEIAVPDP